MRVKGPITAGVDTAIDYGDGHYDTYLSKHAELRHIHLAIEIARRKAKHLSGNPQQRATKEVFHTLPVTVGCIMADFLGRGDAGIMRSFWTKDGPYHLFTDYQTEGTPQQKFQRGLEERKVGFTRLLALYTERRGVHGFRDFRDRIREDAVDFFGGVGVYAYVPESDSETYVAPGGGGGAAATAAGGGGGGGVAPAAAAAGEDGVSGAGGGGSASDAAPGAGAAGGGSSSGTSTDVTPADPSGRPQ